MLSNFHHFGRKQFLTKALYQMQDSVQTPNLAVSSYPASVADVLCFFVYACASTIWPKFPCITKASIEEIMSPPQWLNVAN